ncbi:MAG: hypothetical protein IJY23_01075 [Clostridia bacterium]|nr:hypothetical protein [Clostridia bacterium]
MAYKKMSKTKTIVTTIAIIAILVGAIAGVVALASGNKSEEGYINVDPKFYIGGLNSDGEYVDAENSIYTRDAFECEESVKVILDFDSNVKYQVFFYDDVDEFISATDVVQKGAEFVTPADATHARILVIPIWDAEIETEDRVVKWYSINKFANQLTIRIQETVEENTDVAA